MTIDSARTAFSRHLELDAPQVRDARLRFQGGDPGDAESASIGAGFSTTVTGRNGVGVEFGIDAEATVTSDVSTEDGVTTYTATTEASVTVNGGVDGRQFDVAIAHTEGIVTSYTVSMPAEVASPDTMAAANPFDPSSMPIGTTIQIDDTHYTTNEFGATFKHIRGESNITESEGSSMLVERTGENTVRVTTGPTQAIQAYNGFGIQFGPVKAMLGVDESLTGSKMQTAEFDLSTPEGLAAYNHFLATGEMPTQNGTGVSDVQTIERVDYSGQSGASLDLPGPIDPEIDGVSTGFSSVVVTQPDGTAVETSMARFGDGVPLTITRSYDASGREIVEARTYTFTVEVTEDNAPLLTDALYGGSPPEGSPVLEPGQTIEISFTEAEMTALQMQAQATYQASTDDGLTAGDTDLARMAGIDVFTGEAIPGYGPAEFAASFIATGWSGTNDYGFAASLFNIADTRDGEYVDLPGTVTVVDSGEASED